MSVHSSYAIARMAWSPPVRQVFTSMLQSGVQLETQATMLASDVSGRNFHPLLLASRREGQLTIAAVVALRFRIGHRKMPPPTVLEMVADALIANDDVDPVTCIA